MNETQLKDKVAVITGSTQGLGAAIAKLFVREGAKVVLAGRSKEKGEALAAALGGVGKAVYHRTDLSKADDCRALIATGLKAFGGIDILVNSAADTNRSTLENFTTDLFEHQFYLNVRAPLLLAQTALPSLRERKGVIINIGSVNAYMGLPNLLVYSATKGALMTASKNLAAALKNTRVRVFCLNVGWMETEGEYAVLAREGKPKDFIQTEGRNMPLGRLIQPGEVADTCLYLASPKAAVFSGSVIDLEQFPIGATYYAAAD